MRKKVASTIETLEHNCNANKGEWVVEKEATYNEVGRKTRSCEICNKVLETAIIPKLETDSSLLSGSEESSGVRYSKGDIERMVSGAIGKVYCYAIDGETIKSQASAVFIDTNGNFVTNAHVVKDAYYIKVKANDRATFYEVDKIYKYNEKNDFAICHMMGFSNSKALKFASSVTPGETVYSFGYPKDAIVMEVNEGKVIGEAQKYIENTAWINNGSSGGALVNSKGELVGITTGSSYDNNFLAVKSQLFANETKPLFYGEEPIDYFYTKRRLSINSFNFKEYFDVNISNRNIGNTVYYDATVSLKEKYRSSNYVFDSSGSFSIDIKTKFGSERNKLNNQRTTSIWFRYYNSSDLFYSKQSEFVYLSVFGSNNLFYEYEYNIGCCFVDAVEYVHK